MSTISELSASNLELLATKIIYFEKLIQMAEKLFELEGCNLEELCRDHAKNLMKYDVALQDCKTVQDLLEIRRDQEKSFHWKSYNEKYSRSLTTRDIEAYIAGESSYVQLCELVLEIVESRRKLEAIVEAFKSMNWSLSNIVKLRIAQLEHIEL